MSESSKEEQLSLDSAARLILEECRTVLPGIQALFGFQLIAVFNQGFSEKLSSGQQQLHFFSIVFTLISIALVMGPAALHRQVDPFSVSQRFIRLATRLLLLSMFPLAISICIEVFLIGNLIMNSAAVAIAFSFVALVLFLSLWVALPIRERRRQKN